MDQQSFNTLVEVLRENHWETLEGIADRATKMGTTMKDFAESISNITQKRKEIVPVIAELYLLIDITKAMLCISDNTEFYPKYSALMDELVEEYCPVEESIDFSQEEF